MCMTQQWGFERSPLHHTQQVQFADAAAGCVRGVACSTNSHMWTAKVAICS